MQARKVSNKAWQAVVELFSLPTTQYLHMHPFLAELSILLGSPHARKALDSCDDRLALRRERCEVATSFFLNNNTKFEEIGAANEGK